MVIHNTSSTYKPADFIVKPSPAKEQLVFGFLVLICWNIYFLKLLSWQTKQIFPSVPLWILLWLLTVGNVTSYNGGNETLLWAGQRLWGSLAGTLLLKNFLDGFPAGQKRICVAAYLLVPPLPLLSAPRQCWSTQCRKLYSSGLVSAGTSGEEQRMMRRREPMQKVEVENKW